mmetsp:Transcript_553/g.666  ORF Transcript_553/g.666 Transcript_553/m.666 type:complete len:157 (+) Transcript_553:54-524(+)|eukprot:CAMPEP_0194135766 /NCGR_PEP_ID=MMETSP0152-20130528/5843_1 /TAXON_ID=1049557 /ORGANISM="Thalassiothrix antarctica, Strain L6-D1" /LENGTH=156 /DNA_ID=CAMNT_0038832153 /DNA_START=21 /DNA_END=491 /DNA_ORIENTATION=-
MNFFSSSGNEDNTLHQPLVYKESNVIDQRTIKNNGFPAVSLRSAIQDNNFSKNKTLMKTGGNALQAVDYLPEKGNNVVAVTVPDFGFFRPGLKEGDSLIVLAPDGSGRVVRAVIPEGCSPGHVFLVDFGAPLVEASVENNDLELVVEEKIEEKEFC